MEQTVLSIANGKTSNVGSRCDERSMPKSCYFQNISHWELRFLILVARQYWNIQIVASAGNASSHYSSEILRRCPLIGAWEKVGFLGFVDSITDVLEQNLVLQLPTLPNAISRSQKLQGRSQKRTQSLVR